MKPITLTDAAAIQIKTGMDRENAIGLRLSFNKAGCSGFSYDLSPVFEGGTMDSDNRFEHDGAVMFVAQSDMTGLSGTEIDYLDDPFTPGLVYHNPNTKDECGCGQTFSFAAPEVRI